MLLRASVISSVIRCCLRQVEMLRRQVGGGVGERNFLLQLPAHEVGC